MEIARKPASDEIDAPVTRLNPRLFRPHPEPIWESPKNAPKRGWSEALEVIDRISAALTTAEAQAREADEYSRKLEAFHREQIEIANEKVAAAERKAAGLAKQLADAEEWLLKVSDALFSRFSRLDISREADGA